MQLTDAEIREILIRERRKKKRIMMRRRRITALVILIVIIGAGIAAGVKIYQDKHSDSKDSSTEAAQTEETQAGEDSSDESQAATSSRGTIFIDAGHGGSDPGSISGDRYEKDDTLEFARSVKLYLENAGFTVVMSRTEDIDVDRAERCTMANNANAALMVSFHRNMAQGDNTGDGVEAYIPSFDTGNSKLLAQNILTALVAQGFTERTITQGEYKNEGSDYDELANVQMPACIVEVGFMNSESDNELFEKNFEANAEAVANAIIDTFTTLESSASTEE